MGYPNAGKSTLLASLSNAAPKIAPYPFTTLHPNIGVVEYSDERQLTVADIPGLIDGAHADRGLGHDFLRHIVRTKALLFVVDGAATESRLPHMDFRSLVKELGLYDPELLRKPALVFANKTDLSCSSIHFEKLEKEAKLHGLHVLYGSADKGAGIGPLASGLRRAVEEGRKPVHGRKRRR